MKTENELKVKSWEKAIITALIEKGPLEQESLYLESRVRGGKGRYPLFFKALKTLESTGAAKSLSYNNHRIWYLNQ